MSAPEEREKPEPVVEVWIDIATKAGWSCEDTSKLKPQSQEAHELTERSQFPFQTAVTAINEWISRVSVVL